MTDADRIRVGGTNLEVVHDLEHVGFMVVAGEESEVADLGYDYTPDVEIDREIEVDPDLSTSGAGSSETSAGTTASSVFDGIDIDPQLDGFPKEFGWDIASLDLPAAHQINTGVKPSGDPVRIGIIDDGIAASHPHLNVDVSASANLTGDSQDLLHPNARHYHGTHVAGIAAANGGTQDGSPAPQPAVDPTETGPESVSSQEATPPRNPDTSKDNVDPATSNTVSITSKANSSKTAEDFAKALLGGNVDIVSGSATFTGDARGIGTFTNGSGTIGLESGIVLSSGDVEKAMGSNDSGDTSTDMSEPGDADLDNLANADTNDASILEFEFTVNNDSQKAFLDYVFGSEEYNEFVGQFNDAFGFFVNGTNEATVPDPSGGTQPASINNINNNENSDLYIDNTSNVVNVEMDGLTVPLDIEADINPSGTNTMKIGIADAIDSIYDSWVFLGSGSLTTTTGAGRDGVAPDAELVSLRFFSTQDDDGDGVPDYIGNFMAAVNEAIVADCDVINASLGFVVDQPEGRQAFVQYIQNYIEELADAADENGIVWVASAGNSANNADNLVPGAAKADDVLSVSATGPTGIRQPDPNADPIKPVTTPANYTTFGEEYVDVSAPGGSFDAYGSFAFTDSNLRNYIGPDGILSAFPADTIAASLANDFPLPSWLMVDPNGSIPYGFLQGTSMSAPQVSGLAALLKAENPSWTPHEIRQVIKATAREDVGQQVYHGHGFIDPVAALQVSDPAEVRGELGNPGADGRDDSGRNELSGGSPRNAGGSSSSGEDSNRGQSRGDGGGRSRGEDDDSDDSRSR